MCLFKWTIEIIQIDRCSIDRYLSLEKKTNLNSNLKYVFFFIEAVYCGSFGLCISLLALHFFYRYIAVCKYVLNNLVENFDFYTRYFFRPEKMYYFDEKHICYTFVLSIFIFVAWTITTYFPMLPDEMREEYYSDVLMDNFLTDSHETSFLVMMYKV